MWKHFVITVLLASIGIRCLLAQPCDRLYMQGMYATHYPQLSGVYVLQSSLPVEHWKDYPVYRHELFELFLYYNPSADALSIGQNHSHSLLKVEKKYGVEIPTDVEYSMDDLFNFLRWKQWDPLHNKFVESGTGYMKPMCVELNTGYCSSGVLHTNVNDGSLYTLNVSAPGDTDSDTSLDVRDVHFKLRVRSFHNIRPVYELITDVVTVPYYLYNQNRKWRVGAEIGSESASNGVVLEMESDAMRVEYAQQTEWYAVSSDGVPQRSALDHLLCHYQSSPDINCQSSSTGACEHGGSCQVDATGMSSCICTPDFRGTRCQIPVLKCEQPVSSEFHTFALSNREGSILSTFCPSGRVLFSICDGVEWSPHGPVDCHDDGLPGFRKRDPPGKIALVVMSLVGLQLVLPFLCYCCFSCCKFDENKLSSDEVPARKRLATFLRACSGFFYVSWWLWIGFLIYYFCARHWHIDLDGTTVWSAVAILAIIFICLLYVVVLCESICSHEYEYLTKLKDIMFAEEQIACMKSESPSIKFKAECWHPKIVTRTIHDGSGEDGNGMHTEMCTVHVTTAAIEEIISYNDCLDASGNFLIPTSDAAVTQIFIELAIEFADDQSKHLYDESFEQFKNSNKNRDAQVDFAVEYDLPSYVKELAIRDPNKRWMTGNYFLLATCLWLTWPYRWLLNSSKSEYHYRVVKKISMSPTSQPLVLIGHSTPVAISNPDDQRLVEVVPVTPPPSYQA